MMRGNETMTEMLRARAFCFADERTSVFGFVSVCLTLSFLLQVVFGLVFAFDFSGDAMRRLTGGYLVRISAYKAIV